LISEWKYHPKQGLQIEFYPEHLSDVMGLGAAVLNKKASCWLKWPKNEILQDLDCRDWTQDRAEKEIVHLSIFKYAADNKSLMEITGIVLDDMNPAKKIESKVPYTGTITVTETELPKPKAKTPAKAPPPLQPPPSQAPGMDLNREPAPTLQTMPTKAPPPGQEEVPPGAGNPQDTDPDGYIPPEELPMPAPAEPTNDSNEEYTR
jgi:hypothetical protein